MTTNVHIPTLLRSDNVHRMNGYYPLLKYRNLFRAMTHEMKLHLCTCYVIFVSVDLCSHACIDGGMLASVVLRWRARLKETFGFDLWLRLTTDLKKALLLPHQVYFY